MYLHCKHGFVEADRWDGTVVPDPVHQRAIARATARGRAVIVVRSRDRRTLVALLRLTKRGARGAVFASPVGWDYPFRAYLPAVEWGRILTRVAEGLDYRNFKHWTTERAPEQATLAADIWAACYRRANPAPILPEIAVPLRNPTEQLREEARDPFFVDDDGERLRAAGGRRR